NERCGLKYLALRGPTMNHTLPTTQRATSARHLGRVDMEALDQLATMLNVNIADLVAAVTTMTGTAAPVSHDLVNVTLASDIIGVFERHGCWLDRGERDLLLTVLQEIAEGRQA